MPLKSLSRSLAVRVAVGVLRKRFETFFGQGNLLGRYRLEESKRLALLLGQLGHLAQASVQNDFSGSNSVPGLLFLISHDAHQRSKCFRRLSERSAADCKTRYWPRSAARHLAAMNGVTASE